MAQYTPCSCDNPYRECFSCAIDYVIRQVRAYPGCECVPKRSLSCDLCGCALLPDWELAFALASAPYEHLPKARAQSRGLKFERLEESAYTSRQDQDQAARELRTEMDNDAVSHDAAMWFVAQCVEEQAAVPEPLREWAVRAIRGEIDRPRCRGKYPGATRWRDALIVGLIDTMVEDMGLKATSGIQEPRSACHAVAEAFVTLRRHPQSYEGVVKIWARRSDLRALSIPERM